MKLKFAVLAAFLGVVAFSAPARADVFSVSLDLPMQFSPTFSQTGSPDVKPSAPVSGYKLGVSLPFLVGLGLENYTAKLDKKAFDPTGLGLTADIDYKVTMYDLFFNLPIPVVNIALGLGVGTAAFGTPFDTDLENAALMQYWASLGIPFAKILDLHVGMHMLSGTHKAKIAGSGDVKLDATMISIGAKVGF